MACVGLLQQSRHFLFRASISTRHPPSRSFGSSPPENSPPLASELSSQAGGFTIAGVIRRCDALGRAVALNENPQISLPILGVLSAFNLIAIGGLHERKTRRKGECRLDKRTRTSSCWMASRTTGKGKNWHTSE